MEIRVASVSVFPGFGKLAGLALAVALALNLRTGYAQISEAGGIVVLEAENFNANLSPRSSHEWDPGTSVVGFSGSSYMEALPNNGANLVAGATSPELQFTVNFTSTGTHYIWIRGYALDGTEDSIHVGIDGGSAAAITLSQYNTWQWSNTLQAGGAASINVPSMGNHTISLWMREDGMRIDRVVLTTAANFAAHTANAWHIPNSAEASGGVTMRNPLVVNAGTPVTIFNGAQFQGAGDPGNQLQTGSTIFYKRTTDVTWSSVPMTFSSTSGNNKYYAATLPAFTAGENIQYYLKIPFSDHLPTFLYGGDSSSQATEIEAIAQANPYTFNVHGMAHQGNNTLNLPADLPAATGYTTENALGTLTFNAPICIVSPPGETNRLFVVERGGSIQVVNNLSTTPTKQTFLDLNAFLAATGGGTLSTVSEQGFLGLAFHPNYATNGLFYIFYSVTINDGGTNNTFERVARFRVSTTNANQADTTTFFPLISQLDEAGNHNGGDLHFGADGYLYISVGDEGGANDQYDNARFINKDFFSAILRIDVDKKAGSLTPNPHSQSSTTFPSAVHAGAYAIPPDNPFIGVTSHNGLTFSASTVRTEIWATGLRNPWRFYFDTPTGRIFTGDVGQDAFEEIDILQAGGDFGWSYYEGNHNGPRIGSLPGGISYVFPIYEYAHGTGDFQGNSVTGGLIYRGSRFSELFEAYLFCDFVDGHMWALRQNGSTWSPSLLLTEANIVSFGVDPRNGDALFANIGSGKIEHLVRTGTSGTNPPALLSQTGAFSNLATLTPNTGIVAYAPNVSFWSDYAIKTRWFSIPNPSATIDFNKDGNWTFPTGSIWIKHFELETTRGDPATRRRLETRFIVKTATGSYGITYKWRPDQSDADLVAESGLDEVINIQVNGSPATQTWHYPSRNECRTCHTPIAGHALSFNTRQLNRTNVFGGQTLNQIQYINDAGYFSAPVTGVNNFPAFAQATDTTQSLEWRARSYFAVNCVQCHQPGGAALGNWDARPTIPTDSANMIDGVLADNRGDPANKFVVAGNTGHSMALLRIQGAGVPRMPPLATNELDPPDIQLLTDWINQDLPQRLSFTDWQTIHFGSPGNPAADANADPDHDGRSNFFEFLAGTDPNDATSFAPDPKLTASNGQLQLNFAQPANRSAVIETSTDLAAWTLWDVPGNTPTFPSMSQMRSMSVTLDADHRFFRLRLSLP
jgi:glucose/arabinose dehydrogenase/mono/diheme cytochrome c family protein